MPEGQDNPMSNKLLTTLSVVAGIVVGSTGMFFTLKDRFTREVEIEVTQKLLTEQRLTRLEEKQKALESTVWTLQTSKQ